MLIGISYLLKNQNAHRLALRYTQICARSYFRNNCGIKVEQQNRQFLIWDDLRRNSFFGSRNYSEMNKTTCWNCQQSQIISLIGTKESFFCSSCGSLKEINNNYNYFSLFGIAENFEINQNELTKTFRQFQSVLHPDKFSQKSEIEQNLSAEVSSLINKAYQTLSIPAKRAEYVLGMRGITIPEDNNFVDKDFLLEIMERNEEVDDADDPMELKNLQKRLQVDMEKSITDFGVNFKRDDLDKAKSCLILLRYYLSLENSIKNKLIKLKVFD